MSMKEEKFGKVGKKAKKPCQYGGGAVFIYHKCSRYKKDNSMKNER